MAQSENINELAKALSAAQSEIKAAEKRGTNPHFRSTYPTLESTWDACRDALTKNGLSVVQLGELLPDKTVLTTTLLHASGQWISGSFPLNPNKNDPQGMGSALTYYRRYSLAAIVGIPAEDDDGNAASQGAKHVTLSDIQAMNQRIGNVPGADDAGSYIVKFGKKYAGRQIAEIPTEDLKSYVSYLVNSAQSQNESLPPFAKEFVEKAKEYLEQKRA